MIQLKVRRTNNLYGTWACEELRVTNMKNEVDKMDEPLGIGKCIEDAIEDFFKSCEKTVGCRPNDYKWR